jgi:SsrA-binding protein
MKIISKNRKASFEYEIMEKFVAGIELKGFEVKSILQGDVSIGEGFVSLKHGEAFLCQVHVTRYKNSHMFDSKMSETRERRLLLTKQELKKIEKITREKGITIIPLNVHYSNSKKIKVEIAICKGKKLHDKRHDLKKKQLDMDVKRASK